MTCTALASAVCLSIAAAEPPVPAAEALLPQETLIAISTPDFATARQWSTNLALWSDAPTGTHQTNQATRRVIAVLRPLEESLEIELDKFAPLIRGQLTLALTQEETGPGFLLLLDAGNQDKALKERLAAFQEKWSAAGKALKSAKAAGVEFTTIALTNDILPQSLSLLLPRPVGTNAPVAQGREIVFGQSGSLLIVADTLKSAERVASRITAARMGLSAPGIVFQRAQREILSNTFCCGWVNGRALRGVFSRLPSAQADAADQASPREIKPSRLMAGLGLSDFDTLVFGARSIGGGALLRCFIDAPQTNRHGLLSILPGEPKESTPPPFVPADTLKFRRWRVNGQATWANLEKMIEALSPQSLRAVNFVIDSAGAKAKVDDPAYDLRKQLLGNLGDDFISYQRPVGGGAVSNAWIHLLSAPDANGLALAMKKLFVIFPAGDAVAEREVAGHKVYSVPLPSLALDPDSPPPTEPAVPRTLHFGAASGRVALSTDGSLIEDYLKNPENSAQALRDTPGLLDAANKVIKPEGGIFGCHKQGTDFIVYSWSGDTNGLTFQVLATMSRK